MKKRIHINILLSIFFALTFANLYSQDFRDWKNHYLLLNEKEHAEFINLFEFNNKTDLERYLINDLRIPDLCYRQSIKSIKFNCLDTTIYQNIIIYKSCPETLSDYDHPRFDKLKLFIYSNDSIISKRGKTITINSISDWVFNYYVRTSENLECYSPNFSRFVIICADNYSFKNLKKVIEEGYNGYIKAIEFISDNYYKRSLSSQEDSIVNELKKAIPFNVELDLVNIKHTKLPPPPPPLTNYDSIIQLIDVYIEQDSKIDTFLVSEDMFRNINKIPYVDTLIVDFSTTGGVSGEFIPYTIWKCLDTINIKRQWGYWLFESKDVKGVLDKYELEEYYIGEPYKDGRTGIYFYNTEKYLLRNDTIYSIQEKSTLTEDSILSLIVRHHINGHHNSIYKRILDINSYTEYSVLFYKGIGCQEYSDIDEYYTRNVVMENYWETEFGNFYKIVLYSKPNFYQSNCIQRTEYIINDNFEFYGISMELKRTEAVWLEKIKSDLVQYKKKYCN